MNSFMIPDQIKVIVDTNPDKAARLEKGTEILLLDEVVISNPIDIDFSCVDASGRKHCVSMTQNLLRKLAKIVTPKEDKKP